MKTYKHIFDKITSKEKIKEAILNASKYKTGRGKVKRVLEDIDRYVDVTQRILREHSYEPEKEMLHTINEGISKKTREIEKPKFFPKQVVENVLILGLKPIVLKSLYKYAYGSLENRGVDQAKDVMEKWIQNDVKGTKYCFQCDIKKFYPSINQNILIERYEKIIKDEEFLIENSKIIRSSPKGLGLGAPTSIWHSHFYLTPLDHYITQLDGVTHYLRYADDMFIFGNNKRKLKDVSEKIIEYISEELYLKIKKNHQIFKVSYTDKNGNIHGRPVNAVGYLFYRDRTILREQHMLKTTEKARKLKKKKDEKKNISSHEACQIVCRAGKLKCADTFNVFDNHISGNVNIRRMKLIIAIDAMKKNGCKDPYRKKKKKKGKRKNKR